MKSTEGLPEVIESLRCQVYTHLGCGMSHSTEISLTVLFTWVLAYFHQTASYQPLFCILSNEHIWWCRLHKGCGASMLTWIVSILSCDCLGTVSIASRCCAWSAEAANLCLHVFLLPAVMFTKFSCSIVILVQYYGSWTDNYLVSVSVALTRPSPY